MDNLDDFVIKNGEEVTSEPLTVSKETILEDINNTFAYDTNTPIPGESIDDKILKSTEDINEDIAMQSLIHKAALIKARKETALHKNKELKENFCKQLLEQQQEEYYNKHGFIMSGDIKRRTRKAIEKNFDKGRYDKFLRNTKSLNN